MGEEEALEGEVGVREARRYKPATFKTKTLKRGSPLAMTERTFSIIKPDATERNLTGAVNAVIEAAGLRIVAQRRIHLSKAQAEKFYGEHAARPFFGELVEFMTRSPVVVQVLEADGAVAKYREVMGATNPANADEGTIRKLFAPSVGENTVHGSDSLENAELEIAQFFTADQIVG
jgi:nucleoside-diphosphate kinase